MRHEVLAMVVTKHMPSAVGAMAMGVLGVPAGVLVAAFLGAAMSFYFRRGAEESIGWIVFGVVVLALAGAWVSLVLPHVDWFGIGAMSAKVDPRVRAGLCALAFQTLWNAGKRLLDRKVETA